MNIAQVEISVKSLIDALVSGSLPAEDFIYELLLAYGHRASTVSMLRNGHYNIAKDPDEIIFKRHLYFKQTQGNELHAEIDRMKSQKLVATNRTRFVVCTNFDHLLAVDTKTGDSLDITLVELPRKFDFFLPWAGMEKAVYQGENPADVKAADKMAKLFDLIKADNFNEERAGDKAALHNLNVFLTRLLFCFFAEDTEIFANNQFSNAIQGHTSEDGSDLADYLNRLFTVLNIPEKERGALPDYLSSFPYVNGGLFADNIPSPGFSRKSRRMLIECGSEMNWSDINPDIFGSMIQTVVHPDQRGGMGMHYTSVTNIMKVIEPLFLNDLYDELDKTSNSATKLQKFQQRLGKIKIFDPACGSGNFLIIAYKELRRLEMELLKRWQQLELERTGQVIQAFSVIKLSQFYGIEIDDFAHEVAILSLWLAEHQMNVEFKTEFGKTHPSLPLKNSGHIVCDNATRLDWRDVCDNRESTVYVLGNPPYLGGKKLSKEQSLDMDASGLKDRKQLDYIGCWFFKASEYIKGIDGKFSFVSTSSICQGEQVHLLWPHLFSQRLDLIYAYKPFRWTNNAKLNAGVWCTIVGFANRNEVNNRFIFDSGYSKSVKKISPYLIGGNQIIVKPESNPINGLRKMSMGSNPVDGKHLILEKYQYLEVIKNAPEASHYFRRYMGGNDFLKGIERYCLWLDEHTKEEAIEIPKINSMIEACREYRINAGRDAKKVAHIPHQFCYRTHKDSEAIILPNTSASSRQYIPVGITDKNTVINKEAFAIYDVKPYIFALLSSTLHRVWLSAIGGRLGEGYRYSVKLVYNTYPVPNLKEAQKEFLSECAFRIITARENYPNSSIFNLYDRKKMPDDLRVAHQELDAALEPIYRKEPFLDDEDRLNHLLIRYHEMTGGQNA